MWGHAGGLWGALALFVLSGCGSGGATTDAGPVPGTDAPAATPLVVRVLSAGDVPVAGAVVAVDGTSRLELLTGADGRASFPIDWSAGPHDVIAWADGYALRAMVDVTREVYDGLMVEGALPLRVRGGPAPARIEVRGSFVGVSDPANWVTVYSNIGFDQVADQAMYVLSLPAGAPFRLTAVEAGYTGDFISYVQPVVTFVELPEHAGSTTNLTLDIDLGTNRVTPTEVSGTFPLPTDPWFETAYPWIVVADPDGFVPYGIPTRAAPNAGGTAIEYATAYRLPGGVTEADATTIFSMNTEDGRTTFANVDGVASGDQTFAMLTPPVLDPAPGGGFMRIFDEASVRLVPGAIFSFTIYDATGVRAEVSGPPGAGRVRLPALPAGAGAAGLFVGELSGFARLCVLDPSDAARARCMLEAIGQSIPVDP